MADIHMSGSPVGYGAQRAYQSTSREGGAGSSANAPQGTAPREATGVKGSAARMGTYANAAGAVVSLALLVGVGIWGYQLLVRDVSGVPVVRAADGPWRVAPEDPGGSRADNQGLAVNEVAGRGTASGPVEQVALAPRPIGLTEEDVPGQALAIVAPPAVDMETVEAAAEPAAEIATDDTFLEAEESMQTASMPIMTNRVEGDIRRPLSNATIQALADQIAADVTPLSASAPVTTPPVKTQLQPLETVEADSPVIDAPGVKRSLRPRKRPEQVIRAAASVPVAAPESSAAETVPELAAATLPSGTRLVQLGAYESAAIAQQEWTRIAGKFDSFFDGKARVIQKAQSGGRTFYRLRAHGFDDLAGARRFCAALVAERADCIPVVMK